MTRELSKYQLLGIFVVFSIVLFVLAQLVAGLIYADGVDSDIFAQLTNSVDVAIKVFGAYLLVLLMFASLGLVISNHWKKPELSKGFKFSLVFSGILTVIYLIFLSSLII